jgi:hypothetical protein
MRQRALLHLRRPRMRHHRMRRLLLPLRHRM